LDRLKMVSKDLVQANMEKLAELFPNVITETIDEKGNLIRAVDLELLKQELSCQVVDGEKERYQLTWPGKKEAMLLAGTPINKTLRPAREESVDWETTGNLYIEGDNLDVLKILQESYLNSIKCIYIDPPYNTGNDFIYRDNFKQDKDEYLAESGQVDENGNLLFQNTESNGRFHSDWLSMMYPRLKLARNLLREDGVIFISIDDGEIHNLRKICDEIFGSKNFGGEIIIQANKGGQDYLQLAKTHEYLLCYFKGDETELNLLPKNDVSNFKYEDKNGKYELRELRNRNPKFNRQNRPNLFYALYVNPDIKDEYNCCAVSLEENNKYSIIVYPLNSVGKDSCWRWGRLLVSKNIEKDSPYNSNIVARQKRDGGWNIYEKSRKTETKAKTIWDETDVRTERGTIIFRHLFNESLFDHPKPVELIYKIIRLGMNTDDIILDFFSGSATTAHAVMQLNAEDGGNRKYIMVQLPEPCPQESEAFKAGFKNIAEIGKERIRRAAKKIKEETGAEIDYGFRVFKVDSSNMKDVYYCPEELTQQQIAATVSNIKEDRTSEDLLFQVMLEWDLELSLPLAKRDILGKEVHFVAGNSLAACFEEGVFEELVREIAKEKPLRAVFRDSSFDNDAARINVEELFKMLSPGTEIKVI